MTAIKYIMCNVFFTNINPHFVLIFLFITGSRLTPSPHRKTCPRSVDDIYLSMDPNRNSLSKHQAILTNRAHIANL